MSENRCKLGNKQCKNIGCDCFKSDFKKRLKDLGPEKNKVLLQELVKFATNHPDTYIRFQPADINDTVLKILTNALTEGLITPTQLFLIGMDQGQQKDWEDYEFLVHHIESLLPNELIETLFPLTRKAVADFWQEDYEAKMDRACEVDIP